MDKNIKDMTSKLTFRYGKKVCSNFNFDPNQGKVDNYM